jgi:two-component system NtrC family sensor kinase
MFDLKQAQIQLMHSEKMAGLGTLVAGIAHEINNPINFVYGLSYTLQKNITELKKFIIELSGDDTEEKFSKAFGTRFEKIEDSINNITEGSSRLKTIVEDLRTFSRLDEAEEKTVDITEGIMSTLRLIQGKYYENIEFICDFQAKPEIDCKPAQLNQVFMNIIINGCQAIQEKKKQNGSYTMGKLSIRTFIPEANSENGDVLAVEIADDGIGMTAEAKNRIFEPFFTTKDVGSGTGMGMSISYSIIENHEGKIEFTSEPGKGTTFTLYLPVFSED